MHNLISYNQLAGWSQTVNNLSQTLDEFNEQTQIINDYYNCLIECDDNQQTCKKICRRMLSS